MDQDRARAVAAFLDRTGWGDAARRPLDADASFRRYERLARADGRTAILMDAPPARGEDVAPFVDVAPRLSSAGLSAPELYAGAPLDGLLLLEDLGDALFAKVAAADPSAEPDLYAAAVDVLAEIARAGPSLGFGDGVGELADAARPIAPYDATALVDEAALFSDWWSPAASGAPASADARAEFLGLLAAACAEAGVADARACLTLRDFHAENLIWLPDRAGVRRVGLLDFQDALVGHPAYDFVSLVDDARRDVPRALAERLADRYFAALGAGDRAGFDAACAALTVQRGLKIVGIFARLALRDGKPRYLDMTPRVWAHVQRGLSHPALEPLRRWIERYAVAPDAAARARVASAPRPASPGAPDAAMLLAAGRGSRLRPITDRTPKPLVALAGAPLISRPLAAVRAQGVARIVVNARHHADQIAAFAADEGLDLSDERDAELETGGGVARAAARLGARFFVLNSDTVWLGPGALDALVAGWRETEMDALLLLAPVETTLGYEGRGDFDLAPDGRVIRRSAEGAAPFVFAGAHIVRARAFDDAPSGRFSLNVIWDALIGRGRCFGRVWRGGAAFVERPEHLAAAERVVTARTAEF